MMIAIIGTGNIGKSLVTKLSAAGHNVKVANSRGPDGIDRDLLVHGAQAATVEQAMDGAEAVILSIPLGRLTSIAPLIKDLPEDVVVIDTSNYYPQRDERIEAIEAGQVESLWVTEQLGRPVVKAWNAIGSASLSEKSKPAGEPGRIALPVAGETARERELAMTLVDDTGFDAVDAGTLAESWRQQPGAPCYGTDLSREEMPGALAAAERSRLSPRPP